MLNKPRDVSNSIPVKLAGICMDEAALCITLLSEEGLYNGYYVPSREADFLGTILSRNYHLQSHITDLFHTQRHACERSTFVCGMYVCIWFFACVRSYMYVWIHMCTCACSTIYLYGFWERDSGPDLQSEHAAYWANSSALTVFWRKLFLGGSK